MILREHKGSSFHLTVNASDRGTFSLYKGGQSTGVTVSNRIEIKVISAVHRQLTCLKFLSLPPLAAVADVLFNTAFNPFIRDLPSLVQV